MGILEPVLSAEWGFPSFQLSNWISVKICGNCKMAANKAVLVEEYPHSHIEYIFAHFACGRVFKKLELCQAYQQLFWKRLAEKSSQSVCT